MKNITFTPVRSIIISPTSAYPHTFRSKSVSKPTQFAEWTTARVKDRHKFRPPTIRKVCVREGAYAVLNSRNPVEFLKNSRNPVRFFYILQIP